MNKITVQHFDPRCLRDLNLNYYSDGYSEVSFTISLENCHIRVGDLISISVDYCHDIHYRGRVTSLCIDKDGVDVTVSHLECQPFSVFKPVHPDMPEIEPIGRKLLDACRRKPYEKT